MPGLNCLICPTNAAILPLQPSSKTLQVERHAGVTFGGAGREFKRAVVCGLGVGCAKAGSAEGAAAVGKGPLDGRGSVVRDRVG